MATERYETNPFLEGMIVPMKGRQVKLSRLGKDQNILVNNGTGEELGTHVLTYKTVDTNKFVKLFTDNIGLTFDLTSAGLRAFGVLVWAVQARALNKDVVTLDSITLDEFLAGKPVSDKASRLSLSTLRRGITELEKAKILAKTLRRGQYFINPNFIFNGDRIAFTMVISRNRKPSSPTNTGPFLVRED